MTRRLRALARLGAVALHLLHGLLIIGTRFRRAEASGKAQLIGWWSGKLVRLLGIRLVVDGQPLQAGLLALNHVSWLDFAVVQAACPQARFVAKADVRHWPLLGPLASGAGTLFIERERKRDALRVVHDIAAALQRGDVVAVFPEGTTGPGTPLLPFHTNLLQAAVALLAPVQPVALRYGEGDARFSPSVQYLEDTTLIGSAWRVACASGLTAHVGFAAQSVSPHTDRRALGAWVAGRIDAALGGSDARPAERRP